jgi:hypothetical protein
MLVHANQVLPRAPRTVELNLCDFPRSHHTSVVFEASMASRSNGTCSSRASTSPRRSVGRSKAGARASTGGRGWSADPTYGGRISRVCPDGPIGRHRHERAAPALAVTTVDAPS